jgi:hypothetical protein
MALKKRWTHHIRRENLDDVRARFPSPQYFRRRKGARHDELIITATQTDHLQIQGRSDNEFRAS